MGERLGYMNGSFGRLVDVLAARVAAAGVKLRMATPVRAIRPVDGGVEVATRKDAAVFDSVLFTPAPAELVRVAGDHLPEDYRNRLAAVDHTHALCCILELDRPLTGYYWLNIADPAFPFGGSDINTTMKTIHVSATKFTTLLHRPRCQGPRRGQPPRRRLTKPHSTGSP